MASTPQAYLNPNAPNRAKNPPPDVSVLIYGADLPRGPRHTLAAMYRAAGNPIAKDTDRGILLWPALKGITIEAQIAERTARYHLRKLEALQVIEQVYEANSRIRPGYTRRTATYRLLVPNLKPRQNYERYKQALPIAMPKRPRSEKATESAAPPPPPPVAQPAPPEKPRAIEFRKLTSRQAAKLVALVKGYKQGRTRMGDGREGLGRKLSPGDPEYRAPMSQYDAIVAACEELGYQLQAALEYLKLVPGSNVGDA